MGGKSLRGRQPESHAMARKTHGEIDIRLFRQRPHQRQSIRAEPHRTRPPVRDLSPYGFGEIPRHEPVKPALYFGRDLVLVPRLHIAEVVPPPAKQESPIR